MRGTMRERPEGSGKWQLRVYAGRDQNNNPLQVSKTFTGGKRAAQSALAALVAEVEKGNAPLSGSTTVAELVEKYVEHMTPLRSPTTIRDYASKGRRIAAVLGSIKVSKLTAMDLDRAYRGWLAEGLSEATVNHLHSLVSAALNQAVRWGVVPFAVTERASPPPLRSPAVPEIDPTVIHRLIEAAEGSRAPLLPTTIALAAITGARRGELAGLRWSDLDTEAGFIKISRSVKRGLGSSELVVGPTKTHQERQVSLDPLTVAVLQRRLVEAHGVARAAGVELDPDGYILSLDPTGRTPLRPDSIGQAYRRVARRIGVQLRLHDLRHFAATHMIAAGLDPVTVAARLGHADPSVTLRIYAAAVEAKDKEAAALLGQLVVGQGEPEPLALPPAAA